MAYTIRDLNEEWNIWNEIVNNATSSFTYTQDWIEFQNRLGKNSKQYIILNNDQPIGLINLEISKRKIAKLAYSPYGPVIKNENLADLENILIEIKKFGQDFCKENGLNVFRIDPLLESKCIEKFKSTNWQESLALGIPKYEWIVDLDEDTDKLIMNQEKETRYYINRGEKKRVTVSKANSKEEVLEFVELMKETMARNNFVNFSANYYVKQWEELNSKGITEIWIGRFEGKAISGALINYHKDKAYYSHGASSSDKAMSNLASPYFLQWSIIKDAAKKGLKEYSFFGIVPKGIQHPWRGLSDFKMKFNGRVVEYTGPFEVYSNPLGYNINKLADWWNYRDLRY
jgi:lipid II:glycine glycyltransferase (peptidoglycan interpeptide bridge formation enzyme)